MSGVQPGGLGKYAVRGTLGRGAMGTVYDGWDPAIDRRVAIKTVRLPEAHDEEAQEGLARFKREAQAAGRLNHPNIVGVFDYGETSDVAFIVMEFVEGQTLKDVLAGEERLRLDDAVRLMQDVLAGLAYSHERGVVHRDIKPANIMITQARRAKIADFGIARIESSSMTQAGTVMGTPAYMSPEQFMGQTVDRRTDIYSSGVLLYQLLTSERPFEGSLTAIMHKALNTVPPLPSELSVTAPVVLDAVVRQAMARRPEDRFDTAEAFSLALTQAMAAPVAPLAAGAGVDADATIVANAPPPVIAPGPLPSPAPAARTRSPVPIVAAGGVALLIAAGGAWFALSGPGRMTVAGTVPPVAGPMTTPAPAPSPPATVAPPVIAPVTAPVVAPVTAPATAPVTAPVTAKSEPPPPSPAPPSAVQAPTPPASASSAPVPAAPAPSAPAPSAPGPQSLALVVPPVGAPVPPPATPAPARSAADIASTLATTLPGLGCTLAHAAVSPGAAVTVSGVVGRGMPETMLHHAVAMLDPAATEWQVASFDGPYCPALDVLRPLAEAARAGAGLVMAQANGPAALADNAVIAVDLTMPGFGGYLHLAYLQHDGTVSPLVPGAGYPARTYAAGSKVAFGRPGGGFEGWHVGPPFGTDMIVAVASSAPLFSAALPDSQPLAAYLHDLQGAMDMLRRRGGSLAASALVLETRAGGTP